MSGADCFRSRVPGVCSVCQRVANPLHSPLKLPSHFCADHCPACVQTAGAAVVPASIEAEKKPEEGFQQPREVLKRLAGRP